MDARIFQSASVCALATTLMGHAPAIAQDDVVQTNPTSTVQSQIADESAGETSSGGAPIVVTGSRLRRRTSDGASPIAVLDSEALGQTGQASLGNVVANLTINSGSQFNADLQGQGGTVGTAGFNLRGLGLNSTLVLVNGHRSVEYATNNNVGDTFVDVNSLVPQIAIERIDILKDGAAALYGSDAVAGVANFITRSNFSGLEMRAGFQSAASGAQKEYSIAGIAGGSTDRLHGVVAIEYVDRGILETGEQPELTDGRDVSPLSRPGSFLPLALLPTPGGALAFQPVGAPMVDPLCGDPRVGGLPNAQVPGLCSGDFTPFNTLVPSDERLLIFGEVTFDVSESAQVSLDMAYADSTSVALGYPGNPLLFFPFVPADNPGNTFTYQSAFGPPGSGQFIGDPVPTRFLGRAFGPQEPGVNYVFDHELFRVGLDGRFSLTDSWELNAHYGYSESKATADRPDLDREELLRALRGEGGPNGDLYFNPFANALIAAPGDPQFNDPAVIDAIKVISTENLSRVLHTASLSANGDLFDLPAGPVAMAFGIDFRHEEIGADYSDLANNDGLAFFLGDPDFSGDREVYALFAEVGIPLTDRLDLQLAGRFEDYPTGSSFDPKIGVVYEPADFVTLRGSYSTSFRAPNLFQLFGFTTGVEAIDDGLTGQSNTNPSIRTTRNATLRNENSKAWAFGIDLEPVDRLRFSVDYWSFDFEDRIVREVAQEAVDSDTASRLAGGPGDPRVVRDPQTLGISRIDLSFLNAASLQTDGLDFALTYTISTDSIGRFEFSADATRVLSYDIQEAAQGPVIDGNGNRNFLNIGVSQPKWRANGGVSWSSGSVRASFTGRYIDSYVDDRAGGGVIDSQFTLDAQASVAVGTGWNEGEVRLTVGAINIFDELPPEAVSQQGFDAQVHDPRGRVLYAKLTAAF